MSQRLLHIRDVLADAVELAAATVRDDFKVACDTGLLHVASKTKAADYVTPTDTKAELIIKRVLFNAFPNIAFVGEETGGVPAAKGYFLVDPVDGTSNFIAGRDYFAVCASYNKGNQVLASAIADPCRNIVIKAAKGRGAFIGNDRVLIKPFSDDCLAVAQIESEIHPGSKYEWVVDRLDPTRKTSGLRKSGSTALDLVNLARGRKIVCVASDLEPYDVAAGMLIAREAGALVTNFNGRAATYKDTTILAAAPVNHAQALRLINI